MEGRITTPPTMSGVQKRARQGKAEGISRLNKAIGVSDNSCSLRCLSAQVAISQAEHHAQKMFTTQTAELFGAVWPAALFRSAGKLLAMLKSCPILGRRGHFPAWLAENDVAISRCQSLILGNIQ
jgi:hypothetical protein